MDASKVVCNYIYTFLMIINNNKSTFLIVNFGLLDAVYDTLTGIHKKLCHYEYWLHQGKFSGQEVTAVLD